MPTPTTMPSLCEQQGSTPFTTPVASNATAAAAATPSIAPTVSGGEAGSNLDEDGQPAAKVSSAWVFTIMALKRSKRSVPPTLPIRLLIVDSSCSWLHTQ